MIADLAHTVSRRQFVKTAGTAAVSLAASGPLLASVAPAKRRYAIIGTGDRGTSMWGRSVAQQYGDVVEFVGLCDINPKRVALAPGFIGVPCPTFTNLDEMLDRAKPDILVVTTVDAYHAGIIVKALDRGIDVLTEKPMVTDEQQCQAVLDAEKRSGKKLTVTFNYRYPPKHLLVKELLMSGEIGRIISVDFSWYLDVIHGADYFRRWHRLKAKSGSLWVHKASHHFDLINWWLDAEPVEVTASGGLNVYGKNGTQRSTTCRACPYKASCRFHYDITASERYMKMYVGCEDADGYHRDGCVFREDIDIYDSMTALVKYSNGVTMTYSTNAFLPIEGYRLAFNGEKGRVEIRDYERQGWTPEATTEVAVLPSFGARRVVSVPIVQGGHGGGDERLKDIIFRQEQVPAHMRLPDSRAGAMSCLTGIAARTSIEQKRTVKIGDLVRL